MRRDIVYVIGLFLALTLPLDRAWGEADFHYAIDISPERPDLDGIVNVTILVQGLSAEGLEVKTLRLDPGLKFEAESIRPRVDPASGGRAVECRIELKAVLTGWRSIELIELVGKEGTLKLGPIRLETGRAAGRNPEISAWRWIAPREVRRYQTFGLRLEREDGSQAPPDASSSFAPPAGASLEAAAPLDWTATALEEGELRLPEALIGSGGRVVGRAPAVSIRVIPLPAALVESRAVGNFTLRLDGAGKIPAVAGRSLLFRLILGGRGNQPLLRLPEPVVFLAGRRLPVDALALRRVDDTHAAGGAYEGSAILEIGITPPLPGRLRIVVPPLSVLGPDGAIRELSAAEAELDVLPASGGSGAETMNEASPFGAQAAAAERLAARFPDLKALPGLLPEARHGAALTLLDAARNAHRGRLMRDDGDFLAAALRWDLGERGRALALLYGLLRRNPAAPGAAEAAAACSGELGSGPPLLDGLGPPLSFAAVAAVSVLGALVLFLVSRGGRGAEPRSREGSYRSSSRFSFRRRPLAAVGALILFATALVAGSLAASASQERRTVYAVLWTDRLVTVPSPAAEGSVAVIRGSVARVRGEAQGYVGLVLADGLAGWAPRNVVYYY